jgi:hypothetical protein
MQNAIPQVHHGKKGVNPLGAVQLRLGVVKIGAMVSPAQAAASSIRSSHEFC